MNLIEVLNKHNVQFKQAGEHHHVSSRDWVGIDCPNCSPHSGRFRAAFNTNTGRFNCWTCGKANPVIMLADACKIARTAAYELLQGVGQVWHEPATHTGSYVPPSGQSTLLEQHRKYLLSRNLDPDEIENVWGVQGIGLHSRFPWRLFIPICDERGKEVSWTTRSISDKVDRRYISASSEEEAVPHKNLLYGSHLCRSTMIICEGPLDAWAVGPGAVATFGTAYSDDQVAVMVAASERYVCFDTEDSAQKKAHQLCKRLAAFPGTTENIVLETGTDPASASKAELEELRALFNYFEKTAKNRQN